jgi:hypothetical protein
VPEAVRACSAARWASRLAATSACQRPHHARLNRAPRLPRPTHTCDAAKPTPVHLCLLLLRLVLRAQGGVDGLRITCPKRLLIGARWGSKPLAFAGKLQPRTATHQVAVLYSPDASSAAANSVSSLAFVIARLAASSSSIVASISEAAATASASISARSAMMSTAVHADISGHRGYNGALYRPPHCHYLPPPAAGSNNGTPSSDTAGKIVCKRR